MRRFMLGLAATVTLLVLTLSFKTTAFGHGTRLNPPSAHASAKSRVRRSAPKRGAKSVRMLMILFGVRHSMLRISCAETLDNPCNMSGT